MIDTCAAGLRTDSSDLPVKCGLIKELQLIAQASRSASFHPHTNCLLFGFHILLAPDQTVHLWGSGSMGIIAFCKIVVQYYECEPVGVGHVIFGLQKILRCWFFAIPNPRHIIQKAYMPFNATS